MTKDMLLPPLCLSRSRPPPPSPNVGLATMMAASGHRPPPRGASYLLRPELARCGLLSRKKIIFFKSSDPSSPAAASCPPGSGGATASTAALHHRPTLTIGADTPRRLHRLPRISHRPLRRHPHCLRSAVISPVSTASRRAARKLPLQPGSKVSPQSPNPNPNFLPDSNFSTNLDD